MKFYLSKMNFTDEDQIKRISFEYSLDTIYEN